MSELLCRWNVARKTAKFCSDSLRPCSVRIHARDRVEFAFQKGRNWFGHFRVGPKFGREEKLYSEFTKYREAITQK